MHDALKSRSGYHREIDEALHDDFLRKTLDKFAVAYRTTITQSSGVMHF